MKRRTSLFIKLVIFVMAALLLSGCKLKSFKETDERTGREEKMKIRKPVLSGTFYPSGKDELNKMVKEFIDRAKFKEIKGRPFGFIVPHAGMVYSGPVAAYSYKEAAPLPVKTFIIVGFSHRGWFGQIAVSESDYWETPLGKIKVDKEMAEMLVKSNPNIKFMEEEYFNDNSIEVQLPFIQFINKSAMILPVAFGEQSMEECEILASALLPIVKERKDVVILFSSDMSHYHSYSQAVAMDKESLDLIKKMEIKTLYNKSGAGEVELCGIAPVVTAMIIAKNLGIKKAEVLKYANSGDVTGDKGQVVGYCAVGFYSGVELIPSGNEGAGSIEAGFLNESEKKTLLKLARGSIEASFKGKKLEELSPSENLKKESGVFVTLTEKDGDLRGCIGYIEGIEPLYKAVPEMATAAAFRDPRFPQLSESEFKNIEIEISVLTPLKLTKDVKEIEVGRHGIYIKKGFYSGLLLPQVATDYNWDRLTFLEQTCHKAGLDKDAWKEKDAKIYIFSAQIFHE